PTLLHPPFPTRRSSDLRLRNRHLALLFDSVVEGAPAGDTLSNGATDASRFELRPRCAEYGLRRTKALNQLSCVPGPQTGYQPQRDRKSTRLNSSHVSVS